MAKCQFFYLSNPFLNQFDTVAWWMKLTFVRGGLMLMTRHLGCTYANLGTEPLWTPEVTYHPEKDQTLPYMVFFGYFLLFSGWKKPIESRCFFDPQKLWVSKLTAWAPRNLWFQAGGHDLYGQLHLHGSHRHRNLAGWTNLEDGG